MRDPAAGRFVVNPWSRIMSRRHILFAAFCLAPALALAQMATAPFEGRLKKIQETKTISVAYRTDALPFSYEEADKTAAGYTVDLCRSIIGVIERQIGVSPLQVKWVPVTTQNRFSAISGGQADMECGASSVTLGRMKEVSFSTLTFIDGTGLLVRASTQANALLDLAGKKIGVISGTSNERALADALKAKVVTATIVSVKSRDDGLAQLEAGAIDAFASDRVLLVGLASQAKDPKSLALLVDALSYEPYAIALPRGDWAMKQAVDAALAQIYRSSAIAEIYSRWFGGMGKPGPVLEAMYGMGRLPE
jgi:ABC-type amino acid transport substrate-binding protein